MLGDDEPGGRHGMLLLLLLLQEARRDRPVRERLRLRMGFWWSLGEYRLPRHWAIGWPIDILNELSRGRRPGYELVLRAHGLILVCRHDGRCRRRERCDRTMGNLHASGVLLGAGVVLG